MMSLSLSIRSALLFYLVGIIIFYFREPSDWVWFAVGGGLALVNVLFAALAIRFGLNALRQKALFMGLLLLKSLTFVALIALILVFLKPKLLPFTLGVGVVIFGAIGAALYEARQYFRDKNIKGPSDLG